MEQWNNVELCDLSRKNATPSATIIMSNNEDHDFAAKSDGISNNNNNNNNNNANLKDNNGVLQAGSQIKPILSLDDVESLVRRLYGITISECKELISYDDRNFFIIEDENIKNPLITKNSPSGYVFKVLNSLDSKKLQFIDAQTQTLIYLGEENVKCPQPIKNAMGNYYSVENLKGNQHVVRLLTYLPGKILHEVPLNNYLLFQAGEYLAKTDVILKKFTHFAYDTHRTLWMLQSVPELRNFTYALNNVQREKMVQEIIEKFEEKVLSQLESFETQIIHGDYNEQNIVVEQVPEGDEYRVAGIIDFGDTSRSPVLFEVGIALTYMLLQAKSLASGGIFLAGYNSIRKLSSHESDCLKYCVAARLAQSLTMGAYTHAQDPSNEYVLVTQTQGWNLLAQLWNTDFKNVDELWQTTGDTYLTQSFK